MDAMEIANRITKHKVLGTTLDLDELREDIEALADPEDCAECENMDTHTRDWERTKTAQQDVVIAILEASKATTPSTAKAIEVAIELLKYMGGR